MSAKPEYYWQGDVAHVKYPGNSVGSPVSESKVQGLIDQGLLKKKGETFLSGLTSIFGTSSPKKASTPSNRIMENPLHKVLRSGPSPLSSRPTPQYTNNRYNSRRAAMVGYLASKHQGNANSMNANLQKGLPERPEGSNWGEISNANKRVVSGEIGAYRGGRRNKKTRSTNKNRRTRRK
jgi:hypothetical protein